MNIVSLYRSIVDIGTRATKSQETNSRLRVVNSFCISLTLVGIFCGIFYFWISQSEYLFGVSVAFASTFVIPIALNHVNRPQASKLAFLLLANLVVLYYGCAFGKQTSTEVIGVVLIGFPFIIATRHEKKILKFGLMLPIAVYAQLIGSNYQIFPSLQGIEPVVDYLSWSVIILGFAFNYTV